MKAVLADGTELNFPDGTDPAVVQATARRVTQSRLGASGTATGTPNAPAVGGSPPPSQTNAPEGVLKADGSSDLADRVQYGLAGVGVQGYLGAKQLFGKLSPEEEQVLAMSKADVDHSGFAGKAANLLGNVGAGVAASILTPAMAGPAAIAKAMPYIKAAAGSGAMAGVTTPVDQPKEQGLSDLVTGAPAGDSIGLAKAKEALKAAAVGPLALAGGQAVAKGATGLFTATKDAIDLMRQGITPTLQQAAEGRFGQFVGGLTSGFTNTKKRLENEVADALTNRISNGNVEAPGATIGQRLGLLDASLQNEYDQVLSGKKFPLTASIRDDMLRQGDNLGKSGGRFIDQVKDARGALDNIVGSDRNAVRMGSDTLRTNYLNPLQTAISDSNDPMVKSALVSAKNILIEKSRNAKLTPEELAQLQSTDSRYFDLQRLREAGSGNDTGVSAAKLSSAYENAPGMDRMGATNATNDELIGPLVRTLGKTPRQDEARTALINVGRAAGLFGASHLTGTSALMAPLYGISALGQTGVGSRMLTGQTGFQQSLKSALESPQTKEVSLANALRVLRDNASTLGAGLTPGQ